MLMVNTDTGKSVLGNLFFGPELDDEHSIFTMSSNFKLVSIYHKIIWDSITATSINLSSR